MRHGEILQRALLDLVRLCVRDGVGRVNIQMEDAVVDGEDVGMWSLELWEGPNPKASDEPIRKADRIRCLSEPSAPKDN